MKRFLLICISIILAASCKKDVISEDPYRLFDDTSLPALTVSISQDEWDRLLKLYDADNDTKQYVLCDVSLDDGDRSFSVRDAGFRLRGNTSRRRPQSKGSGKMVHFHAGLHMRKFSETNPSLAGFRRINLKYPKEDPSHIREHYCYDLLSRYGVWTAPETSWCKLYLNVGTKSYYYGPYLMLESIDKQYVSRRPKFGPGDGFLWKCGWGANLKSKDNKLFHYDDNGTASHAYELKDDDAEAFFQAKDQLLGFITKLNGLQGDEFKAWIEKVCDVELLLRTYAVNVAVGHWDDYWNNKNNYYLYFNSRDLENYRVFMICYDYDNTLGTTKDCGVQRDAGRQDPYKWGMDECPLISKLLSFSDYREIYTRFLRELGADGNEWFSYGASAARIREWQALMKPFLDNDTGEDTELADRPASWGNHGEYRLLEDGTNNWFRVKCRVLNAL